MMYFKQRAQLGFALPAVIFLIVIVGLIIAALERINSNQTATSTMGLQSARAYMAAYSGIEWAAYQVQTSVGNTCPPDGTIPGLDLYGFQVSIDECIKTVYVEGVKLVSTFELTVLASYGSIGNYGIDPDFAARELTVSMVME